MKNKSLESLERILQLIASGKLPKELYDEYLSDTEIGFKSFKDLKEYFNLERLEQLDKENQELIVNKNLAQKIAIEFRHKIDKLDKENQELKLIIDKHTNTIGHNGLQMSYLQEEIDKLEKALDLACEKFDFIYHCLLDTINDLDYVCPITLNFIDDLERENKSWKKYFLNLADVEVLE